MRIGHSLLPRDGMGTRRWLPARMLALVLLLGVAACRPAREKPTPPGDQVTTQGAPETKPQEKEPVAEAPPAKEPPGSEPQMGGSGTGTGHTAKAKPGTVDHGTGTAQTGTAADDMETGGTGMGTGTAGSGMDSEETGGTGMGTAGSGTGGITGSSPPASPTAASAFPWPPPRPSTSAAIPENLLPSPDGRATLGDVGKRLRQALEQQGYVDVAWYPTPDKQGFVLFTHIEQIHTDGTPLSGNARFLPQVAREYHGLSDFLAALFMAPPGRFRVIAFVVMKGDIPFSDETLSRSEANRLLQGPQRLNSEVSRLPFTSDHEVYALVYEFTKRRSEPEGTFVQDSALPALQHLKAAGLLGAMQKELP